MCPDFIVETQAIKLNIRHNLRGNSSYSSANQIDPPESVGDLISTHGPNQSERVNRQCRRAAAKEGKSSRGKDKPNRSFIASRGTRTSGIHGFIIWPKH